MINPYGFPQGSELSDGGCYEVDDFGGFTEGLQAGFRTVLEHFSGDKGADTFVFSSDDGAIRDWIIDFDQGEDMIVLHDMGHTFEDLTIGSSGHGDHLIIRDGKMTITLRDAGDLTLTADGFNFTEADLLG